MLGAPRPTTSYNELHCRGDAPTLAAIALDEIRQVSDTDSLRAALQDALGSAYTIDNEMAQGGMSTLYLATDHALDRKIVVKVLPRELAAEISVQRFNREIQLTARLQHPHIVPTLFAGEADGLPYYAMPFVQGESLRARLVRGPLSVRETISVLRDVSRALAYAHSNDIVHRDIKPDNILLAGSAAVVTDFGVAKAASDSRRDRARAVKQAVPTVSSLTQAGFSIGTPAYMAPEQAAGDPSTDFRADLYAVGVLAYEMLVGVPPFHATTPQRVLAAQLTENPVPIWERRYDLPGGFADLVMSLLEKEPSKRPKSADQVVRMLDDPLTTSGAFRSAQRASSTRRRSNVARTIGLFIGGLLVAAAIWYGLH